jgi:hypothetical protein
MIGDSLEKFIKNLEKNMIVDSLEIVVSLEPKIKI